ncbi:MAG TPA: MFS transporter [Streptosporangiaceae bacterium]|jgi:MFS family permease|nr:MFS transporter [Streptosporangiaceae bacterium]
MAQSAVTYREVLDVREYRYLFVAWGLSLAGDQMAKIALSFLVFDTTRSTGLAAAAFAISYVPWVIGGPLLSSLADRLPRRAVMVSCDAIRAVLIGAMVLPGLPPGALIGMLFVAGLFRPPFQTARSALLPEILAGDRYVAGTALDGIIYQLCTVGGFAGGGVLVAVLTARGALAFDAVTFAVSGLLIYTWVASRPAAAGAGDSRRRGLAAGAAVVFGDGALRAYVLLFWLASGFMYATEGLAAPLSRLYGGGPRTGGLIVAAAPFGMCVTSAILPRLVPPSVRSRLIVPLAAFGCAALVLVWLRPPLWVVLCLLCAAGVGSTFSTLLNPLFGRAVPAAYRGRAFGIAVAGVSATQGLAQILAGVIAEHRTATSVIGVSGAAGVIAVLAVATVWPRQPDPARDAGEAGATASDGPPGPGQAAPATPGRGGQPGRGGTTPDSSAGPSR